jgi:hypothetical protein
MSDLMTLLPHSKKDVKLDTKNERAVVNEVSNDACDDADGLRMM